MEDEQIISLFFDRSEEALGELDEKYGSGCRGIAMNILRNREDAEESVSDSYLAVWNLIPPQHPNPLRAYIFRIVRNISVTRYHKNKAQKRDSSYDVALDELAGCLSTGKSVEDELSAGELTRLLNTFLGSLDRESRVLFVRRYWYGDPVSAIADRMGLRPNTAAVRLSRLRDRLREYLVKEGVSV